MDCQLQITDFHLPPPSCLGTVRTTRAEGDFRTKPPSEFVTDEEEANSLARHGTVLGTVPRKIGYPTEMSRRHGTSAAPVAPRKKILGIRENDTLNALLFFACLECGSRFLICDLERHGHNGEIDSRESMSAPKATFTMLCCERCSTRTRSTTRRTRSSASSTPRSGSSQGGHPPPVPRRAGTHDSSSPQMLEQHNAKNP